MRGIAVIYIPTTLLAMVDASIGGKTGVDTPFGKNLIGSFYHPKEIFIDVEYLKSLPEKEWRNGLGEILKYGLIANEPLFKRCEEDFLHWKEETILEHLIFNSIQTKVGVVEMDPEEMGYRRILNFGHTIGHALEHLSKYQIPHGEAVAMGCMTESYLSCNLGHLPREVLNRILRVYQKFGFSVKGLNKVKLKDLLQAMTLDKKSKDQTPRFVLLDQIGHCTPFDGEYCTKIPVSELEQLIDWIQNE
jgi:3-dehydroquinate synthase